ncbi:hypothetical protein C8Q74DRAFT_864692 [Fomes fomentarius]|nr:hypothetical protein C8Q74DRAFT_864692 [Fomes fomentarius]
MEHPIQVSSCPLHTSSSFPLLGVYSTAFLPRTTLTCSLFNSSLGRVSLRMDGKAYQANLMDQCAAGNHDATKKYGICGILCAIFLFPCGLICLCTDSEKRCVRCGVKC